MSAHRLLELYRRETRVSQAKVRAVEQGLEGRDVPVAGPMAPTSRAIFPRPRLRAWLVGATLVAAGAVALVLAWPRPPPHLDLVLAAPQTQRVELGDSVHLVYEGQGAVSGTTRETEITWAVGTLAVEVEPDRGLKLVVHTREADVRVVGTSFEVTRDALGTHVRVERGMVEVACRFGDVGFITRGETRTCEPISAASQLGRARRLRAEGVGADRVLAAAERGLVMAVPGTAVHGELLLVQILCLDELGRTEQALEGAEAYLDGEPGGAREQVEELAEELRKELESEGE